MLKRIFVALGVSSIFITAAFAAMTFSDVPAGHWAYSAIEWANSAKIMTGPGEMPGKFDPAGEVNRAQLAAVSERLYNYMKKDMDAMKTEMQTMKTDMEAMQKEIQALEKMGTDYFTAIMNGKNEIPEVVVMSANQPQGTAKVWLSGNDLKYEITVQDLTSDITDAHFHTGTSAEEGPAVKGIPFSGNTAAGVWINLTDEEKNNLLTGKMYINIHTVDYPDGEIRGQLMEPFVL